MSEQLLGFIGLGNMGGGMAANQVKAGRTVRAFDLSDSALVKASDSGCMACSSTAEAVKGADSHRIHVFVATSAIHREFKLKMAKEEIIKSAVGAVTMARFTPCLR